MPFTRRADVAPAVRSGATLIELLVVLVILGIAFGVAAFTLNGEPASMQPRSAAAVIHAVRSRAIASGQAVTIVVQASTGPELVTALPDGRVLGANAAMVPAAGLSSVRHDE